MKKVAVLSRYKENNNFWHDLVSQKYEVIVYNKHNGDNLLPNIGREGHTYLNYIIENYDNLPDELLFSQYDPIDHFSKKRKIPFETEMNIFLNKNLLDFCGISPTDFDMIVRKRTINWIGFSTELYGKFESKKINELLACGATLYGIFRVSKKAILRNKIDFYKKALEMISRGVDPYEGYYFERMWKFIFTKIGCEQKHLEMFNNKIFMFGSLDPDAPFSKTEQWKLNNYGHLKLSEDGTLRSNGNISYYSHFNESFWTTRDGFLYLLDGSGAATSRFQIHESVDLQVMVGDQSVGGPNEWRERIMKLSKPFLFI
jgi:hypothetical protein